MLVQAEDCQSCVVRGKNRADWLVQEIMRRDAYIETDGVGALTLNTDAPCERYSALQAPARLRSERFCLGLVNIIWQVQVLMD